MLDLLLNPLYACNVKGYCKGCWVTEAGLERKDPLHKAREWLKALKTLPAVRKIDICGGEPLLWPELYDFCSKLEIPWALTTNLLSYAFTRFVDQPLANCLCWTATYHPESGMEKESFLDRVKAISEHYPVGIAILECAPYALRLSKFFQGQRFPFCLEPYEARPIKLEKELFSCAGGQNFLFIAPDGGCFPCVDSQRANENSLGNIFEGTLELPKERLKCSLACNTWNVLIPRHKEGDVHNLQVKPL